MIGYVYVTVINDEDSSLDCHYYIGKREKEQFDKDYVGSGKILKDYLKNHDKDKLKVEIICWCETKEELDNKEKEFIEIVKDDEFCLNIAKGGTGGDTFSGLSEKERQERREKLSKNLKERWGKLSKEERSKLAKYMIRNRTHWGNEGKKFSEEWRQKQSEGIKKWYSNPENCNKIKIMREKIEKTKSTEEYKKKLHESRVKMWQNPEYRKKRSEIQRQIMKERFLDGRLDNFRLSQVGKTPWNKGKTLSEETKRKLSNSHKGKHLSEQTKEKIRQKTIEQWKHQKGEL